MKRTAPPSPLLPLLLVTLPLLWLVFLAWQGTKNQKSTIRELQREAAADYARRIVADLTVLPSQALRYPKFPDPPVPTDAAMDDPVLDQNNLPALRALAADPAAGLSAAGLPRRVLAAVRLAELGKPEPGLAELVTTTAPSILTTRILEKYHRGNLFTINAWKDFDRLKPTINRMPNGGWFTDQSRVYWGRDAGDSWEFLPRSRILGTLRAPKSDSDSFDAFLAPASSPVQQAEDSGMLAYATLPGATEGIRVEVRATGFGRFEEISELSESWSRLTFGGAALFCLLGIYYMYRNLRRERRLNAMKTQFVASVSHELRSPIASIRLMAESLQAGKIDPAAGGEFHRLIARESARLSTLVGNILDHSRIEQGLRDWKMEPCQLDRLVEDTARVMETLAGEKNISLKVHTLAIEAKVDSDAIQQALVNLLDNAIKFSPAGTTIHLKMDTDQPSRSWEIAVTDEGPGIPKAEHSRIFDLFYRPGDELRRETQGTGIGLHLVQSIAIAHQGKILVDSAPGKGSTFTLRIPLS